MFLLFCSLTPLWMKRTNELIWNNNETHINRTRVASGGAPPVAAIRVQQTFSKARKVLFPLHALENLRVLHNTHVSFVRHLGAYRRSLKWPGVCGRNWIICIKIIFIHSIMTETTSWNLFRKWGKIQRLEVTTSVKLMRWKNTIDTRTMTL